MKKWGIYLLFLCSSTFAQNQVVLKKELFEIKTVTEDNLLSIWVVNLALSTTKLRVYNPVNKIIFRKGVPLQGGQYSVSFNMKDGVNGYYRISLVNKNKRLNLYFIKSKILIEGVLKEDINYLFND